MNEIVSHRTRPPTQAAEGVPRWRWTTAELLRLKELGAFSDEDRFELIGGEIVPMSPTGRAHEVVAEDLQEYWLDMAVPGIRIANDRQFNLAADTYTEPDLVIRPDGVKTYDLKGPEALLVVEVADSSLDYDHDAKAKTYAKYGVREYWVINARTLVTTVHTGPGPSGYSSVTTHASTAQLVPHLAPALAVRLADLDLV